MRRLITSVALWSVAASSSIGGALALPLLGGCATPTGAKAGVENPTVRLQRDIAKVDRAIEATKRLLALAHSAPYVPDLYMRLAELYAEQSRYQYLLAYENDRKKTRAVVSIPARLLKEQAVQLYDRVTREYPDYADLDKALFFKGHELRELGNYDEMIATFERLVKDFPRSAFRAQALVILGDYYFDKSQFPRAEDEYKKVLAEKEGSEHAMARYKLAWSRQNQDDCKGALVYFEAAARTALPKALQRSGSAVTGDSAGKKSDLRREALVDSGFCFTEVRKSEDAIPFYRALSDSRAVYVASLSRLARRYHSKGQFKPAALLYREILEVDPYHEDAVEFVQRFYEGLAKVPSPATVERDVDIIVRVAELSYFSPRTSDAIRKAMVHDFEVYARDLSTKAQLLAKDQNDPRLPDLLGQVATSYERYLSFFRDVAKVKESHEIEANLADTLFAAKRFIPAGHAYEAVARRKETGDRKGVLFSAAAAYTQALKQKGNNNYEQVASRAGLYRAGQQYIAQYPKAENLPEIKFNIANALYDEGKFREAIVRFTSLFEQYPNTREGGVAAQLALDSFRLLYDMEGLAKAGQRFLADGRLKDEALRKKLTAVVTAAQQRQLDVLTMTATQSDRGAQTLLTFAAKNAGSTLGEKALINAFTAARDLNDVPQMTKIGEQLLRDYPKSSELVGVLGTLGKLASDEALFDETTRYLSEAGHREDRSPRGQETLRTAAVLRAQRGDRKGAEDDLRTLKEAGAPAQLQSDVALALADLYRHTGDLPALIEVVKSQPQAGPELRMDALNAALLSGSTVDHLAPELRALAGGKSAVSAEARMLLADVARQQLDAIAFTAKRAEDAKVISRRFATQNQVESQYLSVVKSGHPEAAVAALSRLRLLYKGGADFLASAPVPPGLSPGDVGKYQAAFRAKAQPLLYKADEVLKTCAETAQKLHAFSATARACVAGQEPPLIEPFPPAVAPRPTQPDAPALRARLLKNPNDGEALLQLAILHYKAGDLFGAKLVVDRSIDLGGATLSSAQTLAGVIAHDQGEPAEAYRHLQDALKADKRNPKARLSLAALYREAGYGKLAAAEVPGATEVPANLQGDPLILQPAAIQTPSAPAPGEAAPQEKK